MASETESASEIVSGRLYRVMSTQLSALQALGYTVLIEVPKNSIIFCFNVQKEIIRFPFRCLRSIFNVVRYVFNALDRPQSSPPQVAELLTGTRNPEMQQILKATHEIREVVLHTMINQNARLADYRKEVDRWESDNKLEETVVISSDDKEVIRKLADIVKFLRSMKSKKFKVTDTYLKQVMQLVSKDQISPAELRAIKENFQRLTCMNSRYIEGKKARLSSLNSSAKKNKRFTEIILEKEGFYNNILESSIETEIMTKILAHCEKLHLDNCAISNDYISRLSVQDGKLDDILKVTESILKLLIELGDQFRESQLNGRVASLKAQLEEQMKNLKEMETDRNDLKERLCGLEMLILDEEGFLDNREAERNDELSLYDGLMPSSSSQ